MHCLNPRKHLYLNDKLKQTKNSQKQTASKKEADITSTKTIIYDMTIAQLLQTQSRIRITFTNVNISQSNFHKQRLQGVHTSDI